MQTDGSLGSINEILDINNAQNTSGLYFLGNIPNNGTIKSLCAFGKVDAATYNESIEGMEVVGIINFYVIRDGKFYERSFLRHSNGSLLKECRVVNISVRRSDSILVYIPSICRIEEKNGAIDCPLQVNFQDKSSCTEYYEGSDGFDTVSLNPDQIHDVLNRRLIPMDTILNVQITLLEGTKSAVGMSSHWVYCHNC